MSMHDPISDLLTRIRNAKQAKHRYVDFPISRVKLAIVQVLQEKGFVEKVLVNKEKKVARMYLKYANGRECVINELKRVSMPGLRRYASYKDIPRVQGGLGVAIVSTSKGIIDDTKARNEKIGGEILCLIW